jgi:hypothetical protein
LTPYLKSKLKNKRSKGLTKVVECLPSKCKALSLVLSTEEGGEEKKILEILAHRERAVDGHLSSNSFSLSFSTPKSNAS